jgi:LacI family transcriptional regulator, gluconate utilization system Gnt-I transcriptional repressor
MLVGFSHHKVGAAVAGFFLSKGWSKVAVATGDDDRAQLRRKGFLRVIGKDVPTVTNPAPSSLADGRNALTKLLKKDPSIRAIFCSSDALAQGAIVEALAQRIRVPQNIAVCGFGEADFAAHLSPSLTTVQIDGDAIERLSAQLIIDRCNGKETRNKVINVGFRIIERESAPA